jgi:Protein of unknown function (DUF2946)
MSSRLQRKIGSILGLLAILMATLAPTISQAIAASRGADGAADGLCPMHSMQMPMSMPMHGMSMPMPAGMHHEAAPSDPSADSHSLASHWDACGYCSLLAHFPALTASPVLFELTVAVMTQRIATRFESVALIAPFEPAQPRAPPIYL